MLQKAKVSRRKLTLKTTVFTGEQEVTVPASVRIPESAQYLLKPAMLLSKDKLVVTEAPGKVRVHGVLEGFISYVDDSEAVHTLPAPAMEFVAAFATPVLNGNVVYEAHGEIDGVEADQGEGLANITVYIIIYLRGAQAEELELALGAEEDGIYRTDCVSCQQLIEEGYKRETIEMELATIPGTTPVGFDLCLANLSWQVEDGRLTANGVIMAKAHRLTEAGEILVIHGEQDYSLAVDFDSAEIQEGYLDCNFEKVAEVQGPEESLLRLGITLGIHATGYRSEVLEYLTSVADADCQFRTIQLRNRIGESEFKVSLEGDCFFASPPQSIELVLPQVRIIETQALESKVLVRGLLSLNIYFTDDNGLKRVLVQEEEFSQFLDLEGSAKDYHAKTWAWADRAECVEGRYFVSVLIRVEVVEDLAFTAITDIHIVDPTQTAKASVILYTVKASDSLFSVARKFNTTQELLWEYNGLSEQQELGKGQKLIIPIYKTKYEENAR